MSRQDQKKAPGYCDPGALREIERGATYRESPPSECLLDVYSNSSKADWRCHKATEKLPQGNEQEAEATVKAASPF
jgi:hypothetical protein